MDYVDILNAFKEKFNMKTDSFIYDVVKHRPMIFYIDKKEILGGIFKDEIYFYRKID